MARRNHTNLVLVLLEAVQRIKRQEPARTSRERARQYNICDRNNNLLTKGIRKRSRVENGENEKCVGSWSTSHKNRAETVPMDKGNAAIVLCQHLLSNITFLLLFSLVSFAFSFYFFFSGFRVAHRVSCCTMAPGVRFGCAMTPCRARHALPECHPSERESGRARKLEMEKHKKKTEKK